MLLLKKKKSREAGFSMVITNESKGEMNTSAYVFKSQILFDGCEQIAFGL